MFNRIAVATIGAARAEGARHSILSVVPDVSGDTAGDYHLALTTGGAVRLPLEGVGSGI